MSHLTEALDALEVEPTGFFEAASRITEAYCIEHNLPCVRLHTHDELADAFTEVRLAYQALYGQPAPAEACTDVE